MTIERAGNLFWGTGEHMGRRRTPGVQEVNGIPGDTPTSPYEGLARGSIGLENYLQAP